MPIKQEKPFTPLILDEERIGKKRDIVTVALEKNRFLTREQLREAKRILDCPQDSTVIKLLVGIGLNVIQAQIPRDIMTYLMSTKRKRLL